MYIYEISLVEFIFLSLGMFADVPDIIAFDIDDTLYMHVVAEYGTIDTHYNENLDLMQVHKYTISLSWFLKSNQIIIFLFNIDECIAFRLDNNCSPVVLTAPPLLSSLQEPVGVNLQGHNICTLQ